MTDNDRLRAAAEAGRRATTAGPGPMEKDAKISATTRFVWLGIYGATLYAAITQLHGWLAWVVGAHAVASLTLHLFLYSSMQKIKRRKMLLAREQVHRVRALNANNPVSLGLGHLFDADPDLDRLSVEAGVRFALARVHAVMDEADAETPSTLWGQPIDGDARKAKRS